MEAGKKISSFMKILAANRFMPYWIILLAIMRKKWSI